jgi:hypothetical protein
VQQGVDPAAAPRSGNAGQGSGQQGGHYAQHGHHQRQLRRMGQAGHDAPAEVVPAERLGQTGCFEEA